MARTILLRHDTPDGEHHFDWLLETEGDTPGLGPDSAVLISWRLAQPPAAGAMCEATRLPPHRLLYLQYEGPVRERGSVRRESVGRVTSLEVGDSRFRARFELDGRAMHAVGRRIDGAQWMLGFRAAASVD